MSLRLVSTPHVFASIVCWVVSTTAGAETPVETKRTYNLPHGDAATTLGEFAGASGRQIVYMMDKVRGERTNAVAGEYTPREALERMLAGTALVALQDNATGAFVVKRTTPPRPAPPSSKPPEPVPKTMKRKNPFVVVGAWLALTLTHIIHATDGSPTSAQLERGMIEGTVLNAGSGKYLNNARVTVDGTKLEAFTDPAGRFQLANVPAGGIRLKAFYTGLSATEATVMVSPGKTSRYDFLLGEDATLGKDGEKTVVLDVYKVEARREMDAAAIAINEQRFASSIKNVVSTEAFGDVVEGNVGDFVKFLPGVNVDYVSNDARAISLRGVAANYTSVTVDGNRLASASSSSSNRTFELEQVSLNNTSRIEVFKSRTPDIAADALGGAVNLVSRTSFEQTAALLKYRAFATIDGAAEKTLHASPGPGRDSTYKIRPGFDLSYVNPVTKNFGFTVSLLESNIYNTQDFIAANWSPQIVPVTGLDNSKPFLGNISARTGPKITKRESIGVTADWRFAPKDVLTLGAQWNNYSAYFGNRQAGFNIGFGTLPVEYDRGFVHGRLGAGTSTIISDLREKSGITYSSNIGWRHDGPVWRMDGGLSLSHASNHYTDTAEGHFDQMQIKLRGLPNSTTYGNTTPTVWFDGIDKMGYLVPQTLTVYEATNTTNKIDTANPANYNMALATTSPQESSDLFKTARLNARRELGLAFPLGLKAGVQVQQQTRDIRSDNPGNFTFVGPDHLANTADDNVSLYDIVDHSYSGKKYVFGTPPIVMPDSYKAYSLYLQHPDYWTTAPTAIITNSASASKWLQETISAGYVMGDARLVSNRLRLVGGVRFERTKDEGQGQLIDIAAGNGITDAVAKARAQTKTRAAHRSTTYDGSYPSIDAAFNVTPNDMIRAAFSRSIGRQNLSFIIPSTNLPDPTTGFGNITIVNTGLKPTMCNNYDVSIEHYFAKTGLVSVGMFEKDFSHFSGSLPATPVTPALLELYGVANAESYLNGSYTISTRVNVGDAKVTGMEFNYSQILDMQWLPRWARHFTVFANGQRLHLEGSTLADFSNFISKTINYGVKYTAARVTAQVNVNMRGLQRLGAQTWAPGAYSYNDARDLIDANFEYRWHKRAQFFVNLRNLTNNTSDNKNYAPGLPAYARTISRESYGAQYAVGVKGSF